MVDEESFTQTRFLPLGSRKYTSSRKEQEENKPILGFLDHDKVEGISNDAFQMVSPPNSWWTMEVPLI